MPSCFRTSFKRLETFTRMTRVYPNASFTGVSHRQQPKLLSVPESDTTEAAILTVWKKSLLFNCNGFTVFDSKGNLVFRVDNYVDGHKEEILLMDATGNPLLTIRRKKMSLGDCWWVYEGETFVNPILCVRKSMNILNRNCLAYVIPGTTTTTTTATANRNNVVFDIEGSYSQRSCSVYNESRRLVAEIKKKEAVKGIAYGTDIFRLVVQPGHIRTDFAMALVILLDQMFGSSRR